MATISLVDTVVIDVSSKEIFAVADINLGTSEWLDYGCYSLHPVETYRLLACRWQAYPPNSIFEPMTTRFHHDWP